MAIKLLIVDDSAFMRKIILDAVEKIPEIKIGGIARNGLEALKIISKVQPDIVTLDIEMPKLNGIETLKAIKNKHKVPVIMLSSLSGRDVTLEALELGASDFIEKPAIMSVNLNDFKKELEAKIMSIVKRKIGSPTPKDIPKKFQGKQRKDMVKNIEAIVIGASTGGPSALTYLVSNLPNKIKAPIFIVQHMPKGFTRSFARRLNNEAGARVVEAVDRMKIENGMIYLAPGDYHMVVKNNRISLNQGEKLHSVRPAVDHLFNSAAENYGNKLLGIILTGMGRDGSKGMERIKEMGGYTIAQNEETCVVYGMPGNAVALGLVDTVLGLGEISVYINKLLRVK